MGLQQDAAFRACMLADAMDAVRAMPITRAAKLFIVHLLLSQTNYQVISPNDFRRREIAATEWLNDKTIREETKEVVL